MIDDGIIDELLLDLEDRMEKGVENVRHELAKIRTGMASPALLDTITVEAYGSTMPLKQVATVSVPELRLITIQPWDKSLMNEVTRAIQKSDLGLTPSSDGILIRVPIPPLTEERRKELVKLTRKFGEEGKIAVRNVRRDGNDTLKHMEKDSKIREDEHRWASDEVQKLTDKAVHTIDEILKHKEDEIMEV